MRVNIKSKCGRPRARSRPALADGYRLRCFIVRIAYARFDGIRSQMGGHLVSIKHRWTLPMAAAIAVVVARCSFRNGWWINAFPKYIHRSRSAMSHAELCGRLVDGSSRYIYIKHKTRITIPIAFWSSRDEWMMRKQYIYIYNFSVHSRCSDLLSIVHRD